MSYTLFDLSQNYVALFDSIDDPDITEQALQDTLEALDGAIEVKVSNGIGLIKSLQNLEDGIHGSRRVRKPFKTESNTSKTGTSRISRRCRLPKFRLHAERWRLSRILLLSLSTIPKISPISSKFQSLQPLNLTNQKSKTR